MTAPRHPHECPSPTPNFPACTSCRVLRDLEFKTCVTISVSSPINPAFEPLCSSQGPGATLGLNFSAISFHIHQLSPALLSVHYLTATSNPPYHERRTQSVSNDLITRPSGQVSRDFACPRTPSQHRDTDHNAAVLHVRPTTPSLHYLNFKSQDLQTMHLGLIAHSARNFAIFGGASFLSMFATVGVMRSRQRAAIRQYKKTGKFPDVGRSGGGI